ncbi:hypothetical protein N9X60_05915, partial [Paracoccaceae bacterium]|nr:hypothetical protein [Paracoccaceae bacterium]
MCGFFGCISQTPISHRLNLFHKALSKISHRGPDNSSTENGSSWFFGHNRLSIIAPSLESANQPIKSDQNILLFNGMLYNFKELSVLVRSSLNQKEQLSDTKTLFAVLEKFGVEETLNKVDG